MIRRRTLRGIAVLAALAVVSWFLARDPQQTESGPAANLDTRLNYALINFHSDFMDDKGAISVQLEAPFLKNNAASGIGTVDTPDIRVIQGDDIWHITSESAIITSNREFISMVGEVHMTRENRRTGEVLQIDTSDTLLHVTPRIATSDAPVRLHQSDDQLDAVGLKLDMINNSYELLSQVRGTYAIP
jgi:LPS export ABC transporter protein LptC